MSVAAVLAPPASAQRAYVTNSASGSVSLFDTATNSSLGSIPVGAGPTDVAITPDGSRAYVANSADDTVSVIDTATNAAIATVPVGDEPQGIAIAPDGSRVFVANAKADSVSVILTATNTAVGAPIPVGGKPEGIAVTPDGSRAFVAQRGGGIAVLDTATGAILGSIPDTLGPAKIVVTPDGARGFVANRNSSSVTVFSLTNGAVLGSPVLTGANPSGLALSASGPVYASSASDNNVAMIDPVNHTRIGPTISGFAGPAGIAVTADGVRAYVTSSAASSVAVIDAATSSVKGTIPTGASPQAVAIVPDQPPHAFLSAERAKKQGQLIRFDASASTDSDGRVATYAWNFGDGQVESGPSPQVEHTYAKPGAYPITLTATDDQGCSTALVFTGQTASCNGSAVARFSTQVKAIDTIKPVFRLAAGRRQFLSPVVILKARCPKESCSVSLTGMLAHVPTAKVRVSIPAGGKATVKLRLGRKALAAARSSLAHGGSAILQITAVAKDAAANKATRKLKLRLLAAPMKGNSSR